MTTATKLVLSGLGLGMLSGVATVVVAGIGELGFAAVYVMVMLAVTAAVVRFGTWARRVAGILGLLIAAMSAGYVVAGISYGGSVAILAVDALALVGGLLMVAGGLSDLRAGRRSTGAPSQ